MDGRSRCLKGTFAKYLSAYVNIYSYEIYLIVICPSRCNVGYASTCNSVGQTAGYFIGYVLFISLESAEFCNSYLRSTPSDEGILTLPGKKKSSNRKHYYLHTLALGYNNFIYRIFIFLGLGVCHYDNVYCIVQA